MTELPSIQHLLSSLEEPSRTPAYVLPALVLPNKSTAPATAMATAATTTARTAPVRAPFSTEPSRQLPQYPRLSPIKVESPVQDSASIGNTDTSSAYSTNSQPCSCKSHRRNSSHIPRPRNAFILFRQHFHYELFFQNESMLNTLGSFKTNSEISREIGQRWRGLPPKDKQYWHDLAQQEKEKHKLMYPDYKYIPRKVNMDSHQHEYCVKKHRRS